MTAEPPVIAVHRVTKRYRSGLVRGRRITALSEVSLQARRGEIFGLLGPNGAGKTTLIKILLGVIHADGGWASLAGQPAGTLAARRHVGYLPESLRIDRHHTARSALAFYGRMSGLDRATIRHRSSQLISLVGLAGRDRESVRRFSKGMSQRLGLAQALLHDPDLLILDEPTDGLDPVGRSEVRRLLLELKSRGKSIFLNSHILQEVELVCDRVAVMASGQVRGVGTIDELMQQLGDRQVRFDLAGPLQPWQLTTLLTDLLAPTAGQAHWDVRGPATAAAEPQASGTDAAAPRGSRQPRAATAASPVRVDLLADGTLRAVVPWRDQAGIDRMVDALRGAGVSIIAMTTPRRSLEEAFLSLVGPEQSSALVAGG